jgi:magnesium-transporting ATPase (P-type)
MEIFYLFSVRYLRAPSLTFEGILGTRPVLIAITAVTTLQLIFTYLPIFQLWFGTEGPRAGDWLLILGFGILVFVAVEFEKWLIRRRIR